MYKRMNPEGMLYSQELQNPKRVLTKPSKATRNDGHDNDEGDYILQVNDFIHGKNGTQYTIIDMLGCGTFGTVLRLQIISETK